MYEKLKASLIHHSGATPPPPPPPLLPSGSTHISSRAAHALEPHPAHHISNCPLPPRILPSVLCASAAPPCLHRLPRASLSMQNRGHLRLRTRSAQRLKSLGCPAGAVAGRQEGTPFIHTLSAAGAGTATILATNPFFVVKTRLQTQGMAMVSQAPWQQKKYKGTFHALRSIAKYEGLSGIYRWERRARFLPSCLAHSHREAARREGLPAG